jgi:hypothetical protein
MERNWNAWAITRFITTQYERYSNHLLAFVYGGGISTYSILVASLLLTGFSVYYALVYDWLPDYQSDPLFLLQVPFLFTRYTVVAGILLAYFDTTSFVPMEACALFFSYFTGTLLLSLVIPYSLAPREYP